MIKNVNSVSFNVLLNRVKLYLRPVTQTLKKNVPFLFLLAITSEQNSDRRNCSVSSRLLEPST
jgi:hypothetical protein